MSVNYARSTYSELLDRVVSDIDRDDELVSLSPDKVIAWIVRAQEEICKQSSVEEEYKLHYSDQTVDYTLQDRPPITGVSTTGAPITITSVAHELAVNDVIFSRDVQGSVAANGRFRVITVPTSSTFTIKRYGRITGISSDANPVITSKDHPFLTGDNVTIADVLGATEVNGTWAATKIDSDSFSVNILGAARNAYTGGGYAVADATNTTAFIGGGRFWKENEVPTHVGVLKDSSTDYNNYIAPVIAMAFEDLEQWRQGRVFDFVYAYPQRMALGYKDGKKFLRLDAKPSDEGDLDILYRMQLVPTSYKNDTLDMTILLPSEHDSAICEFVKARIYGGTLKDAKMAVVHDNEFKRQIQGYNLRQVEPRTKMVYT